MNTRDNFQRRLVAVSAFLGFLSVLLGAFGAHGLKKSVTPEMLVIFETGCRYQMIHALAGLALTGLLSSWNKKVLQTVAIFWWTGTLVFSGSLYLLVLTRAHLWGAVTPLGGLLLMAGWLRLLTSALFYRNAPPANKGFAGE